MILLTSFVRYLSLGALAVVPLASSAACNAQVATVLSSDASDDASSGGGSSGGPETGPVDGGDNTNDCAAKGGRCLPGGAAGPPNYRIPGLGQGKCTGTDQCWIPIPKMGNFPACYTNKDCNGDATISSEWGTCFYGVCMCHTGFNVQANGKCNTTPPPMCAGQGGTCRQNPATCQSTELGSAGDTDYSCGDLIAAVCCNAKTTCTGPAQESAPAGYVPVDFACCNKTSGSHPPICVNGWQTCRGSESPIMPSTAICN